MKLILLNYVMLCALVSTQAQNRTDEQGRKQGPWVKTYEDAQDVRYSGQFKDDKPYGRFKYYYKGGQLSSELRFSGNGSISRTRNFHDTGKLMAEGKYIDQQKDSTWVYFDRSGRKRSVENWNTGELNGLSETYYPNGKVAERIHWYNGTQVGEWKQFFEDGVLKAEATYENGEPEGTMKYYYPNGKPEISGQIHNGFRDGNWVYYNVDGSIQLQVLYQWGKVIKEKKENGVFKEYYNEDIPKSEYTYAKGMRNGPFKDFYDQGEWVIEERPEGPKGEPAESVRVLEGVQVQRSGKYVNDLLEGEVRYFHENGHSDKVEVYKEGVLQKK